MQSLEEYQRTRMVHRRLKKKELRESEIVVNYQKDKDKSYILDKTLVSPEYYEGVPMMIQSGLVINKSPDR